MREVSAVNVVEESRAGGVALRRSLSRVTLLLLRLTRLLLLTKPPLLTKALLLTKLLLLLLILLFSFDENLDWFWARVSMVVGFERYGRGRGSLALEAFVEDDILERVEMGCC